MDLPRTPAPPPVVAGRYRVGRLLGRGGMADVYAAVDERTGDEVAVKLFRDPAGHDPERSVADEARTLARLRHPGLVALLDAGEDDGWPYCVMTLVDGPTLAQRMADGPLDPAETARIGAAVAAALAHVHAQGVVHRDVKPANVLLTADGRPLLGDFGIARLVDATRVTRTSLTMGTASYLAPEQVTGGHLGPPVDVYGLGLVLLECLTGRREYPGPALESALARLHRRPALPADLPGGWAALLERMTADDPAARPTAGDAAAALAVLTARPDAPRSALPLAPAAQEDDGRAFPVDLPAVPAPRTRQRRRRAGLVGALLLAPAAVLATPSALWSGTAASGTGGAAAAPAATATIPAPVGTSAGAPGALGAGPAPAPGGTAAPGGATASPPAGTTPAPAPTTAAETAAGQLRAVPPPTEGPTSTAPPRRSTDGSATERRAERAAAPSRSAADRTRTARPARTAPARPPATGTTAPRPGATSDSGGSGSTGSGSTGSGSSGSGSNGSGSSGSGSSGSGSSGSGSSGSGSRGSAASDNARERKEDRVRDRSGSNRGSSRSEVEAPDDDSDDDDRDDEPRRRRPR